VTSGTKAGVTAVIVLLVAGLILWRRSPLHPNLAPFLVVLALAVVAVMWTFPGIRR